MILSKSYKEVINKIHVDDAMKPLWIKEQVIISNRDFKRVLG